MNGAWTEDGCTNADRGELRKLINKKLTGQAKVEAIRFIDHQMRTKAQADALKKRLESL